MDFNLVLLPPEGEQRDFIEFAQYYFSNKADRYCLSDKVFPHITLTQFQSDLATAQTIKQETQSMSRPGDITFASLNFHFQFGFLYAELTCTHDAWLFELNEQALTILDRHGLEALNASGPDYRPHLTFARMPDTQTIPAIEVRRRFIGTQARRYVIAVGYSDETGQFHGSI